MRRVTTDKKISIRIIIIATFIILLSVTGGLIGYIVFSNWITTADETTSKVAEETNNQIYQQIDTFIQVPEKINKENRRLIENGIVDLKDSIEREKYFVGVLETQTEDVYSFSYGSEAGEYYGARKNKDNSVEIMKNNQDTGGHSWYFSVTEDKVAGEHVLDAGDFDPRTRDWYKVAKRTQKPSFSPIYKHFVMNDLTLSASTPIYNHVGEFQGVLGAHITLSKIERHLKEILENRASSIIFEKKSGELIANSLDLENFSTLKDGAIKRRTLGEINNQSIKLAYNNYKSSANSRFSLDNGKEKQQIYITEYHKNGLDWIILTIVPTSIFTKDIVHNMKIAAILSLLAILGSIFIYLRLTNKFLKPIDSLIKISNKFSQGDLSQRAVIVRNDEIGKLSKSFNNMANTIVLHVNNLEAKVEERTLAFEVTNNELKESKDQLKLILDSTAEAIYGIDLNGNCTFCNASVLKILGYSHDKDLLGKNMHDLIHHTDKNGNPMHLEECKVKKALKDGKGTHADDEVFWRSDGTCFDVTYHSYPQYKNNEIIGAVITFMDHTERKKNMEHIKYLSYHDSLTGLFNRMFFEYELKRLDIKNNLPFSIIFGDVNGLKLTNDIFGHAAGDELLKKSAEILKKVCRENDIVARVGGDEFAIILPNTEYNVAEKIIDRVKIELSNEQIIAIKGSISMGCSTKTSSEQSIERTMENAEEQMYKDKMFNRKNIHSEMLKTIIETLHSKSPREKVHSIAVSEICQNIGQAMDLPETEVRKLKEAGYLHDIGKIILDEELLKKEDLMFLTEEENKEMEQHTVIGYRILNLFDETLDLAEGVLNHHENWDGSGYPNGMKGEEIPLIARIIRIAEDFDTLTTNTEKNPLNTTNALAEIKKQSGILFDPEIANIFIESTRGRFS